MEHWSKLGPCGRHECGKPVGNPAFTIKDDPNAYCSAACVALVTESKGGTKKKMRVASKQFPGTGVFEERCDNCGGQIRLLLKGRDGDYCSKKCLDAKEKVPEVQTNDNDKENTMTEATAPATEKKAPTKPAAKATKAAKGKTKKVTKVPRAHKGRLDVDAKIKVLAKDNPYRGNRGKRFDLIKAGMTVGRYKEVVEKQKGSIYPTAEYFLKVCLKDKAISVG